MAWPPISRNTVPPSSLPPAPPGSSTTVWRGWPPCCGASPWRRRPGGELSVRLLPTSHDCAESAAFRFDTPDGSLGYLTDTGYIPQETAEGLLGSDLLVLESNHDVNMLLAGPYPYHLKRRVLGDQGHLSNETAAAFAADSARAGTRAVILAHLSQENNLPALALETVGQALAETGCDVRLAAAPRSCPGEEYRLEGALCRR